MANTIRRGNERFESFPQRPAGKPASPSSLESRLIPLALYESSLTVEYTSPKREDSGSNPETHTKLLIERLDFI